jgi:glycosyltransferase involved in cell wall biosynthesis
LKVCLVSSFYPPYFGGIETYTRNLAKNLVKLGNEVTVYCSAKPMRPGFYREEGVNIRRMRAPVEIYGTPIAVSSVEILQDKFDIIHCNFPNPYFTAIFAVSLKLRRLPGVLTYHNDLTPVTPNAKRLAEIHDRMSVHMGMYSKFIATTQKTVDGSKILGRYPDRVVVIPHGVDTGRFVERPGAKAQLGLEGKKVVLFVGNLAHPWHVYKGLDILIDAFRKSAVPGSVLLVVGGGALLEKYRVECAGIKDIVFAGQVPNEQLPLYYSASDVFVLPSRVESFGLVLLEAMSCGRPVIGSDTGGIPSIIEHGKNGLLFDSGNVKSLSYSLSLLLNDDSLRSRIALEAFRYARTRDWCGVAERVQDIYREVAA